MTFAFPSQLPTFTTPKDTRKKYANAASAFALIVALGLSAPALAQTAATPTSPQCSIVNDVVTCTGTLADGFTTTTRDVHRTFRFTNLTGAINARNPNGVAINVINDLQPIDITVDSPGLTITSQGANFARPPFVVGSSVAAGILARTSGNISITSNANISIDANTVDLGRVELMAGIAAVTVQRNNEVRDVRIRNDGNITTLPNLSTLFALDLSAIWVGYSATANVQPAPEQTRGGIVDIVNAGQIDSASHNGITVRRYFGGSIRILNSGSIIQRAANRDASFHHAISVIDTLDPTEVSLINDGRITLTPSNLSGRSILEGMYVSKSIGGANSKAATVINNGSIIQIDQSAPQLSTGIRMWPFTTSPTGGVNYTNDPNYTFTAINNGTIDTTYQGIEVAASVNRIITNNGSITVTGKDNFGQGVSFQVRSPGGAITRSYNPLQSITRLHNSATGSIIVRGGDTTPDERNFASGVDFAGGSPVVINEGRIEVAGLNSRGISMATKFLVFNQPSPQTIGIIGEINLSNSGTISATGANSLGIDVRRFIYESRDVFNTRIVNTGTISATGVNASGITMRTQAADPANPGVSGLGESDVVLGASSIVSGGSGTGAAIIYEGGLVHRLTNEGQISAQSDNAIIGGTAREIIVNRGRINGRVSLGDNDDSFVLFSSGNLPSLDGGAGNDSLVLDGVAGESGTLSIGPSTSITNIEAFIKRGGGLWTVRGAPTSGFPTRFDIEAGQLAIVGDFRTQSARVLSGATLAGLGQEATRLGAVTIEDGGTLSPGGTSIGTMELAALTLANRSILRFDLGRAGLVGGADNDLVNVAGNLTLDGELQVVAAPNFGNGIYRLFNYGGTLTDNGLTIGALPGGARAQVQTALANQVNLVVGSAVQFWDGANTSANNVVNGGSGVWSFANRNWTTMAGDANALWSEEFAVFQGTAGTVTIDNSAGNVSATGLQFAVDGYRLDGGPLVLFAPATVRVGDGTAASSGYTATISSVIAGNNVGLVKTDLGTLVLTGINTYFGSTTIEAGTLSISNDRNLGDTSAVIGFNGGRLRVTAPLTTSREWRVMAGGGTFDAGANAFTHAGNLIGTGTLRSVGTGTWTQSGNASAFAGRLELAAGRLDLTGRLGGTLVVSAGATLSGTGTFGNLDLAGVVAPGNIAGTLTATGDVRFRQGSIFQIDLLANGTGDRINAAGRALIEGGTVVIAAPNPARDYVDGGIFRILNAAGGRTGTFAGITENSAFLDFSLLYDATGADVRVEVIRLFPDVATTFNQRQASTGLRDFSQAPGTDSRTVYRTILFQDEGPARASFDAASGEIYSVALASSRRQSGSFAARLNQKSYSTSVEGWRLWGGANSHDGTVKSDGNGGRFDFAGAGETLGVDYRSSDDSFLIGVGGGVSEGAISVSSRLSRAHVEDWFVGGLVRVGQSAKGLSGSLSLVRSQFEGQVRRGVIVGDLARIATSQIKLLATSLDGNVRYSFSNGDFAYGPIVSLEHQSVQLKSFAETGAASLNLASTGSAESRTGYAIGAFGRMSNARGTVDMTIRYGSGGTPHSSANLTLAGAQGTSFQVRASQGDKQLGVITLAGEYMLGRGWSLGGDFLAAFGETECNLGGSATVRFTF